MSEANCEKSVNLLGSDEASSASSKSTEIVLLPKFQRPRGRYDVSSDSSSEESISTAKCELLKKLAAPTQTQSSNLVVWMDPIESAERDEYERLRNEKYYGQKPLVSGTVATPAAAKKKKAPVKKKNSPGIPKQIVIAPVKKKTAPVNTSSTQLKNWPHLAQLMKHTMLTTILMNVDECQVTSELAASNADNPKGNKWSLFYYNLYGGMDGDSSMNHGLIANACWRPLKNATKLKLKIVNIWEYVEKETASLDHQIPQHIVDIASRQFTEYKECQEAEKLANTKAKQQEAVRNQEMLAYQKGQGAKPPGAKGIEGAGRREHSTISY